MTTRIVPSVRSAALLALSAGSCLSAANAAVFTFQHVCGTHTWTHVCATATPCDGGNVIHLNNWGFQSCGGTPQMPAAGDDVIFPVSGTINAGAGMNTITINAGATAGQNANISTVSGYTNNGAVQGIAGDQSWSGLITNNGTWSEDVSGWTRGFNSATFVNAGQLLFPGSVNLVHTSGTNSLTSTAGALIRKNGGGTASISNMTVTNSGSVVSDGGGTLAFNSDTFVSDPGAAYSAGAGGVIAFNSCNIRGPFPMTLGANNSVQFNTFTCAAPVTLSATGGTALLSGNMTASAANTLTNTGLVATAAGDQSRAGAFTNTASGVWTEDVSGWTRVFHSHTFSNAGTLNFPGSVNWVHGSSAVNQFTNTGTVVKSGGGSLQMNGIPRLNQGAMNVLANGGTLQFNGSSFASTGSPSYSVTGPNSSIFWNGTTISGSFPITLASAGGASFTSPTTGGPTTINAAGGAAFINAGTMNTTAGLLTNAGQLAFGGGDHSWSGPWTNAASGVVTEDPSGWTRNLNSVAVTNNGAMNFPGSVNWNHASGANSVLNTGTMNKTAGGTFHANNIASFTNNGTIAVAAGGGTFLLSSLAYSGTGTVTIGAGAGMQLNGCTVSGPVNGANSGGTFQSTGTMTVPASTTTQLNVTGSGFTVNGNLSINTTSGLLRNNNVANVTGGDKAFTGDITNSVGATWTEDASGWSRGLNSHDFTNHGTLNLPGSVNWNHTSGVNTLTNTGTINKTAGGTFHAANITSLTNNGTIAVAAGGGAFQLSSSAYSGSGTVSVDTAGAFRLVGTTITGPVNGAATDTGVVESTGTLTVGAGGAQLNVSGNGFRINGNKAGSPMLTNMAVVSVTGGDKSFTGPVTNNGTWTEDGSGWSRGLNSHIFTNNGVLNLPGSVNWNHTSGTNRLENAAGGVVNKTAGGTFSINVQTTNAGLIDIQSGAFNVNGGLTQTAAGARTVVRAGASLGGAALALGGGRLEGAGTVGQNTTIGGATASPGVGMGALGQLTFSGNYTQGAGGTLEIDVVARPPSSTDRIVVTGTMTLGGTAHVILPENFYPKLGDVYTIATSTSNNRVGVFATLTVDAPDGVEFELSYTTSSALLTVTATTCSPIDFNNDQLFPDNQDLEDFLSVFGGGPCSTGTCSDIDFNNDGLFPDNDDLEAFFRVFGGGPC